MRRKKRVLFENPLIANPHWLAGFSAGEGSFKVRVYESPASKLGFKVQLIFQITQHNRDMQLLKSLIYYLDCGQYNVSNPTASGIFPLRVQNFQITMRKSYRFFVSIIFMG